MSFLEPVPELKSQIGKPKYFWEFRATLMMEEKGKPPRIVTTVPPMDFSVNWMSKVAPKHQNGCGWHPTDLSCVLIGRMREWVQRHRIKVSQHGLKGTQLGVPEPKEE